MMLRSAAVLTAVLTGLIGCSQTDFASPETEVDTRNASFGGSAAKADGFYSECQLLEVLKSVNESTTTVATLVEQGIQEEAAMAIVNHRLGPDGVAGTGDDDLFGDLDELDAQSYVGPVTLDKLVGRVLSRCEIDLDARPYVDSTTFQGMSNSGWARDNVELEATMTVHGIEGTQLHAILTGTDSRDRTIFSRIRKDDQLEALSFGYPLNEIPWNGSSHALRESFPYLPLTIEDGRFEVDEGETQRELSLGTDIMDDTYFDTYDYALVRNQMILRARVRWDGPGSIRRLLVAAKFGAEVDDEGIKRSAKLDERTNSPSLHVGTLNHDVMSGQADWARPFSAVREIHERLSELGQLPEVGAHPDVLLLNPKFYVRSTRSRYHLDLLQLRSMNAVYRNGMRRVGLIVELANQALEGTNLSAEERLEVEAVAVMGQSILDRTLIFERAQPALAEVAPDETFTVETLTLPTRFSSSSRSASLLEINRIIAETTNDALHEWADAVDEVDRIITNSQDRAGRDYLDPFIAWCNEITPALAVNQIVEPYLGEWRSITAGPADQLDAQIVAFNEYLATEQAEGNDDFEGVEPLTAESWAALGRYLEYRTVKIGHRMVEAAGTMALSLWFEQARDFYVPSSSRPWGNFIIDTTDFSEMVTREEWDSIPEDQRAIDVPLDPAKVFHTTLVNEVQIELGIEAPYVERIAELRALVDAGNATPEDTAALEGARFVFDTMRASLTTIAELKGDEILDRLEREGAPSDISWGPAEHSKGITGMLILADMD